MNTENAELIANLTVENHRLERALRIDDITGLGNFRALKEALVERQNKSFGLLFIDIDYFKLVNENHGHLAATGVLRDFGRLLGAATQQENEKVFRYAGDEFVVILDGALDNMVLRAEQLRQLIENRLFKVNGHLGKSAIQITVSIGCRSTIVGESPEKILSDADKALFEAKRKSRNTTVAYQA